MLNNILDIDYGVYYTQNPTYTQHWVLYTWNGLILDFFALPMWQKLREITGKTQVLLERVETSIHQVPQEAPYHMHIIIRFELHSIRAS